METHPDQSRLTNIKIVWVIVGVLAYALPFLFKSEFLDMFYFLGSCLSLGGYLITDSYKMRSIQERVSMSAGIFFICLFLIFEGDDLLDWEYQTYWYVIFCVVITILLWFILLVFKKHYIRH